MATRANLGHCVWSQMLHPVRRSPKAGVLDQRVTEIKVRKAVMNVNVMKWVQ